jgi:hypothetical protein
MGLFLTKTLISALVIAGASELAKRSAALGAVVAALPLTTLMTVSWLYAETRDTAKVSELSIGIAWALLPSYILLLGLPALLRGGMRFPAALAASCALMLLGYAGFGWFLRR